MSLEKIIFGYKRKYYLYDNLCNLEILKKSFNNNPIINTIINEITNMGSYLKILSLMNTLSSIETDELLHDIIIFNEENKGYFFKIIQKAEPRILKKVIENFIKFYYLEGI